MQLVLAALTAGHDRAIAPTVRVRLGRPAGALVAALVSCRGSSAPPEAGSAAPSASRDASVPMTTDAGAPTAGVAPDAGPSRPPRAILFHRFTRAVRLGTTDKVGARTPEPDDVPDAAFDLVVEGDYVQLAVVCEHASFAAVTSRPELDRRPRPSGPVTVPPPTTSKRSAPWAITKHQPVLFPYEDDVLAAWNDAGQLASTRTGAKRSLRLHTYAPEDTLGCKVLAERPDGTWASGPVLQ